MARVTVRTFFEHVEVPLNLRLVAGAEGLERRLSSPRIQKPGLALAGHTSFVHQDRVQVLGLTEVSFLQAMGPAARQTAVDGLLARNVACIVVTKGLAVPEELSSACTRLSTPLFQTEMTSSECIRKLLAYLDDLLSPRCSMHGVLVDVDGVGVLITGASGIGKSECALDLVMRSHRLVADDVVEVRRRGEDLVGQAARTIRNLIEIRGIGILNIAELYGVAATREHKRVELHIELVEWSNQEHFDRTGLEERTHNILGVEVRSHRIPVRPGRHIAGLVEVAARDFLLRRTGHNAPLDLTERIKRELGERANDYLLDSPPDDLKTGELPGLTAAARLAEVNDHIEDEVE